ncbi:universal stress protein [Actinospica durhamensis]|uniref:Universal stress protein n=1 Tax=Actinospica durhamensis TaxID=1508375 RepID=A0A941IS75_9ACTN|nr:universal stress protein [Actinospica durhamensis]MBR7834628.1 universal stress protein [Actinospica durhamensis]
MTSRIVGRVIVGVDGSPGSLEALRFACAQADVLGAVLVPVLAWQVPGDDRPGRRAAGPAYLDALRELAEQDLRDAFEQGLGGPPRHVSLEPWVIRGPAGPTLVESANRLNDLLVVGAGRRGRLRHPLHAGTARYCLVHAVCPVIAVPPPRFPVRVPSQRRLRRDTERLIEECGQGAAAARPNPVDRADPPGPWGSSRSA